MTSSGDKQKDNDLLTSDQPADEKQRSSLEAQISAMTTPQKVELAAKGNREVRRILSRDTSSMVARALIISPLLSEEDIIAFASSSQTNEDILRSIADNRQWTANRQVVAALVQNPRTPPPAAIRFLRNFATNELRIISNNRSVSVVVRQEAKRMLTQRN